MKKHLGRIHTAVTATLIAVIVFGALTLLLSMLEGVPAMLPVADVHARELTAPAARRAISIPYGISSALTLTADGSRLLVTGHAVCWEEGQMFDLHVRVAQSTTKAFAEGHSIDICAGGTRQQWDAEATVEGADAFEAGSARACAEAVEFAQHGIADEYLWCKDIELTTAD
jgi:hypothetical protein